MQSWNCSFLSNNLIHLTQTESAFSDHRNALSYLAAQQSFYLMMFPPKRNVGPTEKRTLFWLLPRTFVNML